MKKFIKSQLEKLPYITNLVKELKQLKENSAYAPGHFYSAVPSLSELKNDEHRIWGKERTDGIKGINLNTENQIKLLSQLSSYYAEMPFKTDDYNGNRYKFDNSLYSFTDAIILYSLIRHLKPKRIIEIGSGHSSAVMLDTNEQFFNKSIQLTFIEPYPQRLNSLLKTGDSELSEIIVEKVQEVPLDKFKQLEAGDILFVDSSHVVKTGSDVNFILFEILPILESGIYIHFHDIFYPFEYPKNWVLDGRNWNEAYFLKSFLLYNNTFEIKLFSDYLHKIHPMAFSEMPLTNKNFGGNLWLEKT